MLRLFRTWLILLLITAVPLHAAPARMGMACAPLPTVMDLESCHHLADAQASTATADDGAAAHASCSACSAPCMGACMPPSAPVTLPAPAGAENVRSATASMLAQFIPDGLRRPPRPLST